MLTPDFPPGSLNSSSLEYLVYPATLQLLNVTKETERALHDLPPSKKQEVRPLTQALQGSLKLHSPQNFSWLAIYCLGRRKAERVVGEGTVWRAPKACRVQKEGVRVHRLRDSKGEGRGEVLKMGVFRLPKQRNKEIQH